MVKKGKIGIPPEKLNVTSGCDDPHSPDYDISEDGFARRDKNWFDLSEPFRKVIQEGAVKFKQMVADEKKNIGLWRKQANG